MAIHRNLNWLFFKFWNGFQLNTINLCPNKIILLSIWWINFWFIIFSLFISSKILFYFIVKILNLLKCNFAHCRIFNQYFSCKLKWILASSNITISLLWFRKEAKLLYIISIRKAEKKIPNENSLHRLASTSDRIILYVTNKSVMNKE